MPTRPFSWCVERLESRRLLAVTGIRDLLYVRVRFSDQVSAPETLAQSQQVTSAATAAIREWSGGKLAFTVTIKDVSLPNSSSSYVSRGEGVLASDATAALRRAGVATASFEHISFRFNGPLGSYGGLGTLGGGMTWIKYTSVSVLAHELGHNLGLSHSSFVDPANNADPFGKGARSEYGDPFSNMGSGGTRDWNATQKWALGFIGNNQVRTVWSTIATTTTVTLASHDDLTAFRPSDVYLVRVPIGTDAVYAEYRRDAGGVVIHVDNGSSPRGGVLIDGNPATATAADAALKAGQSLLNARGPGTADDIRVRVTSISGGNAVITITVGAAATRFVADTGDLPTAGPDQAAFAAYAAALEQGAAVATPQRPPRLAAARTVRVG